MKPRHLLAALVLVPASACISGGESVPMQRFQPRLAPIAGEPVPGTRPLRFGRVATASHLGQEMLWRVSSSEIEADEVHRWAETPGEVLDRRLRDLLFATGGFRESLRGGDPALEVQLVACEGSLEGTARVELILDLSVADEVGHRARLAEEEPLPRRNAEGLAEATAAALGRAADRAAAWVAERLD